MITLIIFVLVMSLLVFVHELGHFVTARKFGIRVDEFGFGLPPRIFGLQRQGKKWHLVWGNREVKPDEPMIYSINWFPIGGFVKIKGENGDAESDPDSFGAKPAWQRIVVLAAGATMNFVLCIFLLTVGFSIGLPSAEPEAGGSYVSPPQVQISEVIKGMPSEAAGLAMGDVIISINGFDISNSKELKDYLRDKQGQEVLVKIDRGGQEIEKSVKVEKSGEAGVIGVGIIDVGMVRYPVHLAFIQALKTSWYWVTMIFTALAALVSQLWSGSKSGVDFAGPVGIAVMTGQAAKLGFVYILQFAAMLSLNLGIINLFPFPALDGGRIIFVAGASARGKKNGGKWENLSHNIGFILLLALIVFVTYRDIIRYGGMMLQSIKNLF